MGIVDPEDVARSHSDPGLVDDIRALKVRSLDLLVKHGIFRHDRDGLRASKEFLERWTELADRHGSLYVALVPLLYEWTGGELLDTEMTIMGSLVIGMLDKTAMGARIDRDRMALREAMGGGRGYEALRDTMRRARADMEGRRL